MKIVASILLSVSVFIVKDFFAYLVLAAYIALVAGMARIPVIYLWRGIRPLAPLILITAIIHIFFTPGRVLWSLGPLSVSQEGVLEASRMAIRLVLLLSGISLVTLTTSPLTLTDGLEKLLSPFRRVGVPAHELAMMMTIALRFMPTLMEELDKLVKAQMARGADFEQGGLARRIRSLIPLLVPLFTGVFRRAEELAMAMESRAYRGGEGRTKLRQLVIGPGDVAALLVTMAVVGVSVALWK